MPKKEVRWFSFPFIAPKGKGAKAQKAQGEILEIDPPEESLPRRAYDDPLRLTPQQRRERIIELLAIGHSRWAAEQQRCASSPTTK